MSAKNYENRLRFVRVMSKDKVGHFSETVYSTPLCLDLISVYSLSLCLCISCVTVWALLPDLNKSDPIFL